MPPQRGPLTVSVIQNNSRNRDPCTVLFETSSIDHIRQVHRKTQKDIADKQEELRQLVGGSYRELLGSADVIMGMRGDADAAVEGLRKVREGFAALVRAGDAPPAATRQTDEALKDRELRNALYGVGCRVKFLVDTPEVIWGCLDESQFAASAERFVSALDVHAVLTTDAAAAKHLSSFSVLRSQWPLVGTFRGVITKRARERLGDGGLAAADVASALAALATLEGDNTASALATFLEYRRAALKASCAAAVEDSSSSPSAALVRAVCMLQSAVCNAGELFLATPGAKPLLAVAIAAVPTEEEQASGIPNPHHEVGLWKQRREELANKLAPLPTSALAAHVRSWLTECAAEVASSASALLSRCTTLRAAPGTSDIGLAEVDAAVRSAILDAEGTAASAAWAAAAASSLPADDEDVSTSAPDTWTTACRLVLGAPVSLWDELFAEPFKARAIALVSDALGRLPLNERLEASLAACSAPPLEPSSGLPSLEAAEAQWGLPADAFKRGAPGAEALEHLSAVRDGPEAPLVAGVDGALRQLRVDLVALLHGAAAAAGQQPGGGRGGAEDAQRERRVSSSGAEPRAPLRASSSVGSFPPTPGGGERAGAVAGAVEAHAQQEAHAALTRVVEDLRAQLGSTKAAWEKETKAPAGGPAGARSAAAAVAIERALLIGRVALALCDKSQEISRLLGPPADWRGEGAARRAAGLAAAATRTTAAERLRARRAAAHARGAPPPPHDPVGAARLSEVQSGLRAVSAEAYGVWADATARELLAFLKGALSADEGLASNATPRGWEETLVSEENPAAAASAAAAAAAAPAAPATGGAPREEMRLALPALPRAYVLEALFRASREVYRVGIGSSAVVPPEALRQLALALGRGALEAYAAACRPGGLALSEKGVLQLVFDVRFLCDVLAVGAPEFAPALGQAGPPAPSALGAALPFKALAKPLLDSLADRLDPIDWATYEPFLVANQRRCYARTAVLLGALISSRPLHVGATSRLTPGPEAAGGAAAPRFSYLPIALPSLSAASPKAGGPIGGAAFQQAQGQQGQQGQPGSLGESALLKGFLGGAAGLGTRGLGALLGEATGQKFGQSFKAGGAAALAGFSDLGGNAASLLGAVIGTANP